MQALRRELSGKSIALVLIAVYLPFRRPQSLMVITIRKPTHQQTQQLSVTPRMHLPSFKLARTRFSLTTFSITAKIV